MPRICASNNDPVDFCRRHMPTEDEAGDPESSLMTRGDGPDARGNCFGYDTEHPDYEDDEYRCEICGKELTRDDN